MRRKSHKTPERLERVRIDAVAAEGKCIVRTDEGVIFVENPTGGPGVAPGDVVDLRVTNRKKQYREAVAERIHEWSAVRTEPFCQHFGTCGGCKWQHIQYAGQLGFKHQQVVDHLTRIGKVPLPAIRSILPAHPTQYYRNKLEFTCAEGRWKTPAEVSSDQFIDPRAVGFHVPGRFDKVLPIQHCYLQPDPSNAIRLAVSDYVFEHDITLYNLKTHTGYLRTLIIRTADSTQQVMVTLQVAQDNPVYLNGLLGHLQTDFPQITSLNYILNTKKNDSYQDQTAINWAGKPYIEEQMDDADGPALTFRIGPKSFYQTNAQQAHNLYKVTREWAGLTGNERVYDLYTGTGTIALFVARRAKEVIGVEYVEASVADARINADINNITNATFAAGDMREILTDSFFDRHGRPEVVITDPPRAGMDEAVTRQLLKAAPSRIVYVSCNTATQARDLGLLDAGYTVADVQPVDMFPHTHHVENVVLLKSR